MQLFAAYGWPLYRNGRPPLTLSRLENPRTPTKTKDNRHGTKFRKPQTLDHEDGRAEVQALFQVRKAALHGRPKRSAGP